MKTNKSKNTMRGSRSVPNQQKKQAAQTPNTAPAAAAAAAAIPALDNQRAALPPWRGVFFHGPDPVPDRRDGDEIPTWLVFVGNDEGEPTGTVYRCFSYLRAQNLAQAMSNDRNLDLIDEAQPAGPLPSVPAQAAAA